MGCAWLKRSLAVTRVQDRWAAAIRLTVWRGLWSKHRDNATVVREWRSTVTRVVACLADYWRRHGYLVGTALFRTENQDTSHEPVPPGLVITRRALNSMVVCTAANHIDQLLPKADDEEHEARRLEIEAKANRDLDALCEFEGDALPD